MKTEAVGVDRFLCGDVLDRMCGRRGTGDKGASSRSSLEDWKQNC